MPLYEYECKKCGTISEFLQKISDPAPSACPSCGESKLEKLVSRTNFILKGTGWYETDFKSKEKTSVNSAGEKITPKPSSAAPEAAAPSPTEAPSPDLAKAPAAPAKSESPASSPTTTE